MNVVISRSGLSHWLALKLLGLDGPWSTRGPDFIIGGHRDPYLERWFLVPRNRWLNVYLHHFLRSDDDRALHDHPWPSLSIALQGTFLEHTIAAGGIHHNRRIQAGDWRFRSPRFAHRIELDDGDAWTLFITGPKVRSWGFHCQQRWVHWREFTDPSTEGATVGRGCGE